MCLMQQRAANNFYHQPQALLGDVRTLYVNCQYYNMETAVLTLRVRRRLRLLTKYTPRPISR